MIRTFYLSLLVLLSSCIEIKLNTGSDDDKTTIRNTTDTAQVIKIEKKLPTTGKYGKICYPPSFEPPLYDIHSLKDGEKYLKDCNEVRGVPIIYMTKLKNLNFLKKAKYLEGIDIKRNLELINLKGMENIEHINDNIVIYGNPKLKDLSALSKIK